MTEQSGAWISFSGPAIDTAEDQIGRAIIAHELAHVAVFAAVRFSALDRNELAMYERVCDDRQQLIECLEDIADRRAESWGFDLGEARRWVATYLSDRENGAE